MTTRSSTGGPATGGTATGDGMSAPRRPGPDGMSPPLRPAPGGRATSAPLIGREAEPTVFELSSPGRHAATFRTTGVPEWTAEELVPDGYLRPEPLPLAEVSERDLVAHVTRLSHRQYSVDLGAYPLG
ncbi:MAG: aminomethyl-transferring glycine dehydrogenase subunit GcvPB, partial [Acidimicrobiales bacterium]